MCWCNRAGNCPSWGQICFPERKHQRYSKAQVQHKATCCASWGCEVFAFWWMCGNAKQIGTAHFYMIWAEYMTGKVAMPQFFAHKAKAVGYTFVHEQTVILYCLLIWMKLVQNPLISWSSKLKGKGNCELLMTCFVMLELSNQNHSLKTESLHSKLHQFT